MNRIISLLLMMALMIQNFTVAHALVGGQYVNLSRVIDNYFEPGIEFDYVDNVAKGFSFGLGGVYKGNKVFLYGNNCTFAKSGSSSSAYRFCLRSTPPGKACQDKDGIYREYIEENGVRTCQAEVNSLTEGVGVALQNKGNATSVELIKSGPDKGKRIPRVQMCLYEDPLDGGDTNGGYMPSHRHTPICDVAPGSEGCKSSKRAGTAVIGSGAATLGSTLIGAKFFGPIGALAGALAGAVSAFFSWLTNLGLSQVNHLVVDVVGCWDLPLAKGPPPFCADYEPPKSDPYIFPICTKDTPLNEQTCIHKNPKLNNDALTFSTFRNPKMHISSDDLVPICNDKSSGTLKTFCAKLHNLSSYQYMETSECTKDIRDYCVDLPKERDGDHIIPKIRYAQKLGQDEDGRLMTYAQKTGVDLGTHIELSYNQCKPLCMAGDPAACDLEIFYHGTLENEQVCVYECKNKCNGNACDKEGGYLIKCAERPPMSLLPKVVCLSEIITGGDGEYYYKLDSQNEPEQCYFKARGYVFHDKQCSYAKTQIEIWKSTTKCQESEPELLKSTDISQCYYEDQGKKIQCDPLYSQDGQVCDRGKRGCLKHHRCNVHNRTVTHNKDCDINQCYVDAQQRCKTKGYPSSSCVEDNIICQPSKLQDWKEFRTGTRKIWFVSCTHNRTVHYAIDNYYFKHRFFAPNNIDNSLDTSLLDAEGVALFARQDDDSLILDDSFRKISNVWFKMSLAENNGICESELVKVQMFDDTMHTIEESDQFSQYGLNFTLTRRAFNEDSLEIPLDKTKKALKPDYYEYLCLDGVTANSLGSVLYKADNDIVVSDYNDGDTIIYDVCKNNQNPKSCTAEQRRQDINDYIRQYYVSLPEEEKTIIREQSIPRIPLTGYEQQRSKNLKEAGLCVKVINRWAE